MLVAEASKDKNRGVMVRSSSGDKETVAMFAYHEL